MAYSTDLLLFQRRRNASGSGAFPLAIVDRLRPHLDKEALANLRAASREIRDVLDSDLPAALQAFARFTPGTMPPKHALVALPKILRWGRVDLAVARQIAWMMLGSASLGFTSGLAYSRGLRALVNSSLLGIEVGLLSTLLASWLAYRDDPQARRVAALEKRLADSPSPPDAPQERAAFLKDLHKATQLRLNRAHRALKLLPVLIEADRLDGALKLFKCLSSDMQVPDALLIATMEQALDPHRHTSGVERLAGETLAAWLEQRGETTSRSAATMQALQRIAADSLDDSGYFRRAPAVELRLRLCWQVLPPLDEIRNVAWYMPQLLQQAADKDQFPLLVSVAEMFADRAMRIGADWCLNTFQHLIRLGVATRESLVARGEQLASQLNDGRGNEERALAALVLTFVREL